MKTASLAGGADLLGKNLSFLCFGVLSGVVLALFFDLNSIFLYGFFLAGFVLLLLGRKKLLIGLLFFAVGFFAGNFLQNKEEKIMQSDFPDCFEGQVYIRKGPTIKNEYQKIVVKPIDSDLFKTNLLIYVDSYPRYFQGDVLMLKCDLKRPENKDLEFDYVRYLAKENIYRICQNTNIEKIENKKTTAGMLAFSMVNKFEKKIDSMLPDAEAAYLAGLLLGGSDRLPDDVADAFRRTGMTHTVAVSGYNITIISAVIMSFLLFCGMWRKHAFWFATGGILVFVYCIGAPASAVRAAIMGILILWAAKQGRLAGSERALLVAATLMVVWSPLILVHDAGFQLSVLATAGIIYLYGPLAITHNIKNDFLELKSIFFVTIAAQIGVLGLIIFLFGMVSPYSLIVNLIILPVIPLIMFLGFLMIVFSFIFLPIAKILSIAVWMLLHFEISIVKFFSKLPFASVSVENIGLFWLTGYYVFFIGLVVFLQKPRKIYGTK